MKYNETAKTLPHTDSSLPSYIQSLTDVNLDSSYYLLVLAGPVASAKLQVLKKLQHTLGTFTEVDLRDVISGDEEGSYKNIDTLFEQLGDSDKNIIFRHGDILAGEYTGHTYSSVRYATPQEKYLLNKIKTSERFIVLDIQEFENIDKMLYRIAQTVITCKSPASGFSKLLWKLRQISLNGHTFTNKRKSVAR